MEGVTQAEGKDPTLDWKMPYQLRHENHREIERFMTLQDRTRFGFIARLFLHHSVKRATIKKKKSVPRGTPKSPKSSIAVPAKTKRHRIKYVY